MEAQTSAADGGAKARTQTIGFCSLEKRVCACMQCMEEVLTNGGEELKSYDFKMLGVIGDVSSGELDSLSI